jgi:hypothetical protein
VRIRRRYLIIGGAALALAGAGVGTGVALVGDGDEAVSGPQAERARAAATAAVAGRAGAVERDGEDGAVWEVEVTRPDGSTVDVRLNGRLQVLRSQPEREGSDGGDSG